ncbi:MAG: ABC transporter ATP-binding protein [Synergistota bacterium]|nr:ABC transporter ATP-binding protein [Synergistota bacterium]
MIEFKNATKRFGQKTAVDDLSLTMEQGSLTMLIGPSGCGKTTSLKMVNRLVDPDGGDILINGTSINDLEPVQLRRSIGYVIQEIGLFPHYSVFDNVAMLPRLHNWKPEKIRDSVHEVLDMVTLDSSYADKYPRQLSGGERQRVGLARALAADPDVLLMDEPFGAIDPINRLTLQESFLEIQEEIKKTIVFVTHDINEAIKLGDRIAIMNQGSLVQHDTVAEILENPDSEFVENLLGHDRNLKALSLKKAKSYISTEGYMTAEPTVDKEKIGDELADKKLKIAYLLDDRKRLAGRIYIEKPKKGGKRGDAIREQQPYRVERNTSLTETLSRMLETGEKRLPVVTRDRRFVGVIDLNAIFAEVEQVQAEKESQE